MVVLKAAVLEGSINEQWHRQSPLAVHLARVWSTTARLVSQIGPEPERGGSTGKAKASRTQSLCFASLSLGEGAFQTLPR